MDYKMYHVNKKYDDSVHSIVKGISLLCVDEIYEGYPEPTILTFMQGNNKDETQKNQVPTQSGSVSANNSAISGSTRS